MEPKIILNFIKKRMWIVILFTVLTTASALIFSGLQTPVYEANSILLVRETSLSSSLFGNILPEMSLKPERSIQTQVELIELNPLLEKVISSLDLKVTPESLKKRIKVELNPDSNIINIKAQASSPENAEKISNTIATEYTKWNTQLNSQEITNARDEIKVKLEETEKNLINIAQKVQKAGGSEGIPEDLRAEWSMATQLYGMLGEKYEQLRIVSAISGGEVVFIAPAKLPKNPIKPNIFRNGAFGIILGIILGFTLAFIVDFFDVTIKDKEEIEELLKLPILGQIPNNIKRKVSSSTKEILVLDKPLSPISESFRTLQNNIHYLKTQKPLKTIMITSPNPGEGKTKISSNLAVLFAQSGKKTILISLDFRKPALTHYFPINNQKGITNIICDNFDLKDTIINHSSGLQLINTGPLPPSPPQILSSKEMQDLLGKMSANNDIVIIDAPPVLPVADVFYIAPFIDGTIVVLNSNKTKKDEAINTIDKLFQVKANILGVILNKVNLDYNKNYYNNTKSNSTISKADNKKIK